jgi:hypothetical protein
MANQRGKAKRFKSEGQGQTLLTCWLFAKHMSSWAGSFRSEASKGSDKEHIMTLLHVVCIGDDLVTNDVYASARLLVVIRLLLHLRRGFSGKVDFCAKNKTKTDNRPCKEVALSMKNC